MRSWLVCRGKIKEDGSFFEKNKDFSETATRKEILVEKNRKNIEKLDFFEEKTRKKIKKNEENTQKFVENCAENSRISLENEEKKREIEENKGEFEENKGESQQNQDVSLENHPVLLENSVDSIAKNTRKSDQKSLKLQENHKKPDFFGIFNKNPIKAEKPR